VEYETYKQEITDLYPSIFDKLSVHTKNTDLGTFINCPKSKDNSIEIESGKSITATLDFNCAFENGFADLHVVLVRNNKIWEIHKQRVTSSVFSPAFNK
jgi:hypothetical protein